MKSGTREVSSGLEIFSSTFTKVTISDHPLAGHDDGVPCQHDPLICLSQSDVLQRGAVSEYPQRA